MKKIIFIIIVFIAVHLCAVSVFAQLPNVTDKKLKEKNKRERYQITAVYPQVDFGPDALMGMRGVAGDINLAIDTVVMQQVNDFKKWAREMKSPGTQGKSTFEMTYETVQASSLFSFKLNVYSNPDGAAHPYVYTASVNYCPASVGLLNISSLFLPDSPYLKYLSDYSVKLLKAHAKDVGVTNIDDMITHGAGPDAENFKVFNVSKDSLLLMFNPGQAGPSVMGIQTVSIPLSGMKDIIDPKGPLEGLL
jgi:hypothetical protein